jgi:hypothetical protein
MPWHHHFLNLLFHVNKTPEAENFGNNANQVVPGKCSSLASILRLVTKTCGYQSLPESISFSQKLDRARTMNPLEANHCCKQVTK